MSKQRSDIPASAQQRYLRDGGAIYRRSFALIRSEANLARFESNLAAVVVRMVHACGMVDLAQDVHASERFFNEARRALLEGAPVLCDTEMVAAGITRSLLPARNEVICTINDPGIRELAKRMGTTRSAAALERWRPRIAGALVVIGNAPTALFRLLELLHEGVRAPAAVIGVPVGFVGAAESKEALAADPIAPAHLIVRGRRGGSAIAAAAVNGLCGGAP
jgi:precorrin-8X/cobalt-precorrin-8 methylmutase